MVKVTSSDEKRHQQIVINMQSRCSSVLYKRIWMYQTLIHITRGYGVNQPIKRDIMHRSVNHVEQLLWW